MDRRRFAALAALAPFSGALRVAAARAEQGGRVIRIAHLNGSGAVPAKPFIDAFRDGMRALGREEGRGWLLDERYAEGKPELLPRLAQDLLEGRPDLILAATTPASIAAKVAAAAQMPPIPVVMVLVADPIASGIVPSLARPGGHVTGITNIVAELAGKRLELLKEIVPAAKRFAVFLHPDNPNAPPQMKSAEAAGARLGVSVGPVLAVRKPEELAPAFDEAVRSGADGALRMSDPLAFLLRHATATLAIRHRLPVIYITREEVEAGGLIAYGANIPGQFRQAAGMVDKILKGAKPADLPVEQPTKFDMAINLKTARAIGLAVPAEILTRADEVIE